MYQLSLLEKNFENFIEDFKEPPWMKQSRYEAFKSYISLPLEASALYSKYSNANKLIAEKVFFNDTNLQLQFFYVTIKKFLNHLSQKSWKKKV